MVEYKVTPPCGDPFRVKIGRVILLVLVLGAVGVVAWISSQGGAQVRLVAAKRGDIMHSFVANGRVESEKTVLVIPRIAARIKDVMVKEGDEVEAGKPLVLLDDASLAAARDEAAKALDAAKARRDRVLAGTRKEDVDVAKAEVSEAEHALVAAMARLAEVEEGSRREDVRAAEAQMHAAEADLAFSKKDWSRMQALVGRGLVTRRDWDDADRRLAVSLANLDEATARLERVQNGSTQQEKAAAQGNTDAAAARLAQANANLARGEAGATAEERRSAEAEVERAQAALARVEADLKETTLLCPFRAIVARRHREPGDLAFPEMPVPILEIASLESRVVRVEVQEGDIYKAHVGLEAEVTSDAYPGKRWKGKLTRLAPSLGRKTLASDRIEEKKDVKVREARIALDEPIDVPLDLPVEARIEEVIRKDVVLIPVRAVDSAGNVTMADGTKRKLEVGDRDDAYVEVKSGLSPGEQVRMPE